MQYDAFISYSHDADTHIAAALRNALQRFAKPWWKARAVRIFLDESVLGAGHDLGSSLRTALSGSRFLILLAAPQSAQSVWVGREVETWLKTDDPERLLIVQTGGTIAWDEGAGDFDWQHTDALASALAGRFEAEPLWIDLAWSRSAGTLSERDPRFMQAVGKIAARLHGRSLDEIAGEDIRRHRQTRRIATAAVIALTLLLAASVAGGWASYVARLEAERNLQIARESADTLVANVAKELADLVGVPESLRISMLSRAEDALSRLGNGETTPALRRSRAVALYTIAAAYLSLGRDEDARERAAEATSTLRELDAQSGDAGVSLDHARAAWTSADILRRTGSAGNALAAYRESLAAIKRARERNSGIFKDEEWLVFRARAHVGLADTLRALAETADPSCGTREQCRAEAKGLYARSMEETSPDGTPPRLVNIHVVGQERLGSMAEQDGDPPAAERFYQSALALVDMLHRQEPSSTRWRENLMAMNWRMAGVMLTQCRAANAVTRAETAVDLARGLYSGERGNLVWSGHLGESLIWLAQALYAAGESDKAHTAAQEAGAIFNAVLENRPDDPRSLSNLDRLRELEAEPASGCAAVSGGNR